MPLFTIIADYDGGTYIKQVNSATPDSAVIDWAAAINAGDLWGIAETSLQRLAATLHDDYQNGPLAVALDETRGVWCASTMVRGKLLLLTIVCTSSPIDAIGGVQAQTPPKRINHGIHEWTAKSQP